MYLENLKNEYKILDDNIKKLEENHSDKNELINLKKELLKLGFKIRGEELFNDYRNKKSLSYHFVDDDGSEIDVMLDYGDVNYESAYKQLRNKILEDEAWETMKFERENPIIVDLNFGNSDKMLSDSSQHIDKEDNPPKHFSKNYRYLVFKVNDRIHIVSDAPVNYLKNNVNLIKNNLGKEDNFNFIRHDEKAGNIIIDGVLVKVNSDGFTLTGDVDAYESSEVVSINTYDKISEKSHNEDTIVSVSDSEKTDNEGTMVSVSDSKKAEDKSTDVTDNSDKKDFSAGDFINLMSEDKYSDILKLIGICGISSLWQKFEDGIKNGSVSNDECKDFIDYLKSKVSEKSSFYGKLFNDDFKRLDDNLLNDIKDEKLSDEVTSPIPVKPVKRKKAKEGLVAKFKSLSRGKKIAVVAAGVIAVVGIGIFASHMIPLIMDKFNTNDVVSNTNPENYKAVGQVSKGIFQNFMDNAHDKYQLVKDSIPHFNTINAGDTVFSSASDSISGINGVSASGDFRDTVVAVFDSATQKVIKITPDNIDSVRSLLDDPNIPKAFGDSFTPGNVSGWKTGTGYKTIVDAVNMVGGKSL